MTLRGGWHADPVWGRVYDWVVEHPAAGVPLWRLVVQSDLRLLYDAAAEIGRQPAGSRGLDVPCGGGVAVRSVRPGQGLTYLAADISPRMLARTRQVARLASVEEQVETVLADVARLPFEDDRFDLVVSFTGLHCFPDPASAVAELCRVLRPGGSITGSTLLEDSGRRFEPMRRLGRAAGLLGPGCTADDVRRWLAACGVTGVTLRRSGAFGYFRGRMG